MIISGKRIIENYGKTSRVFMKDIKRNVFPVYPNQSYKLEPCGRFRLIGDWVHDVDDVRIAYGLIFGGAHESVVGMKVTLVRLTGFQVVNGEATTSMYAEVEEVS